MNHFLKPTTLLLALFTCLLTSGQSKKLFNFHDGLSNSLINKVFYSRHGFIWVATEDGLNRFDGTQFQTYTQNSTSKQSLKANFITSLTEDTKGNLWIGLINGLQVFDHQSETFSEVEVYISDKKISPYVSSILQAQDGLIYIATSGFGLITYNPKTRRTHYSTRFNKRLCSLHLQTMYEDSEGLIWIGSDNEGISVFNPSTNEITNHTVNSKANSLPTDDISSFAEDKSGHIYIGSIKGGLTRYSKTTEIFEPINSNRNTVAHLPIKSLFKDSKQNIWIGTDGFGLKKYNATTHKIENHPLNSSNFDFTKSKIHSIMEDNSGNLWLGIFQKGLYLYPANPAIFKHYGYQAFGDNNNIGSNSISSITGNKQTVWLGTDGDGIYKINRTKQTIEHIQLHDEEGRARGNIILYLADIGNELWIGTFYNGLLRYNKTSGEIKAYRNIPGNSASLPNDKVTIIKPDKKGQLWIGTLGGGICCFDPKTESFTTKTWLRDTVQSQIPLWVNDIFIDQRDHLWVGTYDGLAYVNTDAQTIDVINQESGQLNHNVIYCIEQDSNGNILLGSYNGFVKLNPSNMETEVFTTSNGLGSNVICDIQEDEYKQIWISTHNGLSLFNPSNNSFTVYYAADGIQSNEFSKNASYKSTNNELFFGGINGVTEIKRDYRKYNRKLSSVMLTDLYLYDQQVKIGEQSDGHLILEKSFNLTDTIHLSEADNVFSIGFTSKDLSNPSRLSYEYRMEGFDTHWNSMNSYSKRATYTNLNHGTYTFNVRAVNREQYSKARSVTIIIHPFWYKTLWAKSIWIVLLILLTYGIIRFYKEKLMRLEAEKLNDMKMQFFMNISHEIKTPLTLIIDPLEKLLRINNQDAAISRMYKIMHQNASRIYRLINQLMDVRKIEAQQMPVKFRPINIYSFITEQSKAYEIPASTKNIAFTLSTEQPDIEVWIDPLHFEKVIHNLLSNAFKFTPSGRKIDISTTLISDNKYVQIEVSDSGSGIKNSDIDKIFNRFYQSDSFGAFASGGTGIGLNLTRSLVELHRGKITAHSDGPNRGSKFTITLPLGHSHLPGHLLASDDDNTPITISKRSIEYNNETLTQEKTRAKSNQKIMIVEDEVEIRNYLEEELSEHFKVVTCENGKKAHEVILDEMPDLIVSDIMMPEMNGIAFCKLIKSNIQTSHIPVILLTALSADEDRSEGIDTGADMYLVKPFNSEFLKKVITNMLKNRRNIYEKALNNEEKFEIENIKIESHDDILIQKVMSIIKENISESNLNVEMLAEGVGISRVHMHRKLKELTNQSARDLIKNTRMKQASFLLTSQKINISEVAYAVGYSNLSHFSNSFKTFYGVSPKEYVQKQWVDSEQ